MSERLFDYLLGELAPEERAAFEADPARVADAERLRPIVTRLESLEREEWDPPEAPALVLPGAREPRAGATPPAPRADPAAAGRRRARAAPARDRRRRRAAARRRAAGTTAAACWHSTPSSRRAAPRTAPPRILAGGGRARFVVRGLKPSANGGFYELWLMNSADDLVSLGSFRVPASGNAEVTVPLPADPDGFAALDISAEPADGNPAHSASSVLRAPLKPS